MLKKAVVVVSTVFALLVAGPRIGVDGPALAHRRGALGGAHTNHSTVPTPHTDDTATSAPTDAYMRHLIDNEIRPYVATDPAPWGPLAKHITANVKERIGGAEFPQEALCALPYKWLCGRAPGGGPDCVPNGSIEDVLTERDGRYYQGGRPCGPILYLDHGKRAARTLPLERVLLRIASSLQYLDRYWEAVFNGAAWANEAEYLPLAGLIHHGEHNDSMRFPRNAHWVKLHCIHAAFSISPHVKMVFLLDNDAFFTPYGFEMAANTTFTETFFPPAQEWDVALQDDMPVDELCDGAFSLRRSAWTAQFLADWWHEAVTIETAPYEGVSGPDGCGWFHNFDQSEFNIVVSRKLSGQNGLTYHGSCLISNNTNLPVFMPTPKFAKGAPEAIWKTITQKRVFPIRTNSVSWTVNGVDLAPYTDGLFRRELTLLAKKPPLTDKGIVEGKVSNAPVSGFQWSHFYFHRWNLTVRLQMAAFHMKGTPMPAFVAPIFHTGGSAYNCLRTEIPFHARKSPPQWALDRANLSQPCPNVTTITPTSKPCKKKGNPRWQEMVW